MAGGQVGIGFRVKTGRAVAVAVLGSSAPPDVVLRREVQLWNEAVPDSKQPYHVALEDPGEQGQALVERACNAVREVARGAMRDLVVEIEARDLSVKGVGLVVGSLTDPSKLGNPHVRAHASEGVLFREAMEQAAETCGLPCIVLVERDAHAAAADLLGQSPEHLKQLTTEMGRSVGRPWRALEKSAALSAWVALAR